MKKIIYIVGALMLLFPALAGAQALPYTAAETDAVSLGKAGANLTQTSSVANAAFYNAAAIPFSEDKFDVSAGYTMWQPSAVNTSMINVGAAYNMNNKFGVALGMMYGMNPAYDVISSTGAAKGQFKPSDMHLNVGVAYRFLPILSIGANVGYASSSLATDYLYGAVTADVFFMTEISGLKATLGVANLGTSVTSVDKKKYALPASAALGLGYEMEFAEKHNVNVALDADYYFNGGLAAAVGAEYTFGGLATVRAGYRYGGNTPVPSYASVGAGAKFMGIKLDLAYLIGSGAAKNTLAIGVGYSF